MKLSLCYMGRILALDYGLKRTGIAVTDPLQIIATPLETVLTENLMEYLTTYFKNETVDKVVLGYPLNLDGNETDATQAVEKYKIAFEKLFPDMPIFLKDERLTSRMAKSALIEGGFKKKKRREKGVLDKMSAVFILKSFLNMD